MDAVFEMEGRLPQRPLAALEDQLQSHGITLSRPQPHLLRCSGQLQPGDYTLPGHISSQFISGLLLALPLLDKVSTLTVTGQVESAPYIQLTLDTLRQFGICIEAHDHRYTVHPARFCSPGTVEAEGDWSNAAFWLTAGALGQSVTVSGLNLQSSQGDRIILTLLSQLGASVQQKETSVTVSPGTLRPFTVDVSQIPDLVPILAVAACAAPGVSRITNAGRLRWKESDRLTAICHAINTLGGHAEQTTDSLIIRGGTAFSGGTVDACGDHRIAMAAAIAAILSTGSVTVLGAEAVDKSYPDFWHDFEILQNKTEGALL